MGATLSVTSPTGGGVYPRGMHGMDSFSNREFVDTHACNPRSYQWYAEGIDGGTLPSCLMTSRAYQTSPLALTMATTVAFQASSNSAFSRPSTSKDSNSPTNLSLSPRSRSPSPDERVPSPQPVSIEPRKSESPAHKPLSFSVEALMAKSPKSPRERHSTDADLDHDRTLSPSRSPSDPRDLSTRPHGPYLGMGSPVMERHAFSMEGILSKGPLPPLKTDAGLPPPAFLTSPEAARWAQAAMGAAGPFPWLSGARLGSPPSKLPSKVEGILPKGPYLPCVSMAGRALFGRIPSKCKTVQFNVPLEIWNSPTWHRWSISSGLSGLCRELWA